jgi:hypothetical protein
VFQVGASILHVPSGLFFYGMYQNEQNNGTQWKSLNVNTGRISDSNANETDVWFLKAGIKRGFTQLGATVLWGEWGQYNNMFSGLCGLPGDSPNFASGNTFCQTFLPSGIIQDGRFAGVAYRTDALVTGSEVRRWGVGLVQEIDSAAMHLFVRWQHLDLDLNATNLGVTCGVGFGCFQNGNRGKSLNTSLEGLDIIQGGGVIFF